MLRKLGNINAGPEGRRVARETSEAKESSTRSLFPSIQAAGEA
jgi:hypothetical protein